MTENKYHWNTIYTEKYVIKELNSLYNTLINNEEIIYLWELFVNKKYSRQRFSEWLTDYKDNDEIIQIADTIKEILETRAVKWAITNKLNSTFTIFHLKNNYNWKDKVETDNTNKNYEAKSLSELYEESKKEDKKDLE